QNERLEQQLRTRRDEIVDLKRAVNAAKSGAGDGAKAARGGRTTIVDLRAAGTAAGTNGHPAAGEELEKVREDLESRIAAAALETRATEAGGKNGQAADPMRREHLNDLAAEV